MSRTPSVSRRRIRKLVSFIEAIDSFRIGYVTNIDQLAIEYRRLELSGRTRKWKEIRRDLEEVAVKGLKVPEIRKLMNRDKKLDKYYKYSLIFLAISMVPFLMGIGGRLTFLIMLMALTAVNAVLIYRLYLHDKVVYLYYSNRHLFKDASARLREDVNRLLLELKREARRAQIPLESIRLKLYNTDYEGIRVVKEPSRVRKYFLVSPA